MPVSMVPMEHLVVVGEVGQTEVIAENDSKSKKLKKSVEFDLVKTRKKKHVLKIDFADFAS